MKQIEKVQRRALAVGISHYQKYPGFSIPFLEPSAWTIGVTGAAAAGKSTLIKNLITEFRLQDKTVVALLIDPSSENGWAVLGDRNELRCPALDNDKGLFIRSLATRGEKSSLTTAMGKIINYAACFADIVIVETAGAGQTDVEIEQYVDTLLQVLAPLGSALTLGKAGQNENAHIFAVNDRESFTGGKKYFAVAVRALSGEKTPDGWQKKVLLVNAKENKGIKELTDALSAHRDFKKKTP